MKSHNALRGIAKRVSLILADLVIGLLDRFGRNSQLGWLEAYAVKFFRITDYGAVASSFNGLQNRPNGILHRGVPLLRAHDRPMDRRLERPLRTRNHLHRH